eukprot:SAG22_NODE_1051_length_5815_cov_32.434570_7_plen_62_part_00
MQSETVLLTNGGKTPQQFEFAPDPAAGVTLVPRTGMLPPGGRRRLTIEFKAPDPEQLTVGL